MLKKFKYQIVLLGGNDPAKQALRRQLQTHIEELGVDCNNHVIFLDSTNSAADLIPGAPVVGVFFEGNATASELGFLAHLIAQAYVILPVVNDLRQYYESVPSILHPINGFELQGDINRLSIACLEALNLLRRTRKLFISYRRQESSIAASQLYESLDKSGFDVFLDTISIRSGEPFQEVLWHRLSDSDIVIIMDTPGFLESRWTQEELANASAMSIGLIQLIWPNNNPSARSALCERFYLERKNFTIYDEKTVDHPLTEKTLKELTGAVESMRARAFAARYDNLVKEFKSAADEIGFRTSVQPNRHIFVYGADDKIIATIPAVGVPEAISYHEIDQIYEELANPKIIRTALLYDHRNIRKTWCKHLIWLDRHLPVKSVRIVEAMEWLRAQADF